MSETEDLIASLNRQTAKIPWLELQKFYAAGAVVAVSEQGDLIAIAAEFSRDNKAAVGKWLADGTIVKVGDELAAQWLQQQPLVWAVVVAPWVLVQRVRD